MKLRSCCFSLIASIFLAGGSAQAAESCFCSADYSKYHSGLTWVDFICVFPSSSSGPFTEPQTTSWTHVFGERLVWKKGFFERWDELLLIEEGKEKEQCETTGSNFRRIALGVLQRNCERDGGTSCTTLKMTCTYKAK